MHGNGHGSVCICVQVSETEIGSNVCSIVFVFAKMSGLDPNVILFFSKQWEIRDPICSFNYSLAY